MDEARLWTDGRYFLQAAQELSDQWKLMRIGEDLSVDIWMADVSFFLVFIQISSYELKGLEVHYSVMVPQYPFSQYQFLLQISFTIQCTNLAVCSTVSEFTKRSCNWRGSLVYISRRCKKMGACFQ